MPRILFCSWLNNNERAAWHRAWVHTYTVRARDRDGRTTMCSVKFFYCFRGTINISVGVVGWMRRERECAHATKAAIVSKIQYTVKQNSNSNNNKNRIRFFSLFLSWLQNHFSCNTNEIEWPMYRRRRRDNTACTCWTNIQCIWYAATASPLQNTALHRTTTKCGINSFFFHLTFIGIGRAFGDAYYFYQLCVTIQADRWNAYTHTRSLLTRW